MKRSLLPILFSGAYLACAPAVILFGQQWDTLSPIPESFTFPVVAVADGKIHIMGGGGTGGATDLHFAYDPAADTWESRAAVPYKAQQPAGATVNGKIHYFGGGFPNSGSPLDDHYMYDPVTDSWTEVSPLTSKRAIHYGAGLDSVLYTMAGQGKANVFQSWKESTNAWENEANLPDNGFWYGAHVVTNQQIYRFCGGGYTAPNKLTHRYVPGTGDWIAIAPFPEPRHGIKGAAIGDETIFLAGGYYDFLDRDEVYVYNTVTDSYSTSTALPIGRTYHNVVSVDSCIYVLGGNNAIDPTVSTQLIRLCPFENTTSTFHVQHTPLRLMYAEGTIRILFDDKVSEDPRVSLFAMTGEYLSFHAMESRQSGWLDIDPGPLPSGLYMVQLRSSDNLFVGKIFLP